MLHGYLGSGKTTYAKKLEKEWGAIRFTSDEWMSKLYGDDPPEERFENYQSNVLSLMEIYWSRMLEKGVDVILDLGFWSRDYREDTKRKIEAVGGVAKLYHLSASEDEMRRRCEKRNKDLKGSLHIATNTFEVLKMKYEPLGEDEEFETINSEQVDEKEYKK